MNSPLSLQGHRLLLPRDSKTGPRTAWLGSAVREVNDSLPRDPKISWLFWNRLYRRPTSCIRHLWQTILESADLGKLFGHANHQSTARYAHLDDEHLFDAAQQVGDPVQSLLA